MSRPTDSKSVAARFTPEQVELLEKALEAIIEQSPSTTEVFRAERLLEQIRAAEYAARHARAA